MLRLFRKRNQKLDPAFASKLDDVTWPFWTSLMLRIRPLRGRKFFQGIICMTAKMASIDGAISQPELKLFLDLLETHFSLNNSQKKSARKVLFQVQYSKKEFSDFAKEFYSRFRNSRALVENAFDVLLSMAYVDNILSVSEQKLLGEAAEIFKLSSNTLNRLTQRHHNSKTKIGDLKSPQERHAEQKRAAEQQEQTFKAKEESARQANEHKQKQYRSEHKEEYVKRPGNPYSIIWASVLGVNTDDSITVVKKRYRHLVRQYHPDTLPKDIPAEMLKSSTERFIEIQRAYDAFCKERGISA